MNRFQFDKSLNLTIPPHELSTGLKAMWYDAKGDWEAAHNLVQDESGKEAALIHAYLHRVEGDIWNADYWYGKAGRKRPNVTLKEEWSMIVSELLPEM